MTDSETAKAIRDYYKDGPNTAHFGWPTDGCSYEQHIRFVEHRNQNWNHVGGDTRKAFMEFALAYADALDSGV